MTSEKPGLYQFKGFSRNNETGEIYKLPLCRAREYTIVAGGVKHWHYGTQAFDFIPWADFQPPCARILEAFL